MKRNMKTMAVISLALVFCFFGTVFAYGETVPVTAVPISANVPMSDVQVQLNGEGVEFDDAVPRIIDNRTVVPVRQILETMGFEVLYDPADKTVQATEENLKLSFTVGGTDILIDNNGETTIKKMDLAPFIDKKTSRVYVPVRFIAEGMDWGVFWDQNSKTVVVIDPDSLFSDVDRDFSVMAKLLYNDLDVDKAYETKGTFKAELLTQQIPGLGNLDYVLSGDIEGIQQNSSADLKMNFKFNIDNITEAVPSEEIAMIAPLLELFKEIQMDIKMDAKSGDMFIYSNLYGILYPEAGANTWYKMNFFDVYDEMGMDLRPLMQLDGRNQSLYLLLKTYLFGMNGIDKDSYGELKLGYELMKNLIGDESFAVSKSGVITTYTLKLDRKHIESAIAGIKESWADRIDNIKLDAIEEFIKNMEIRADIVIKDKAEKFYNYYLSCEYSMEDMQMSFLVQGDMNNADVEMSIKQPGIIVMNVKAESGYTETAKTPDLNLPKDAVIKTMDIFPGF